MAGGDLLLSDDAPADDRPEALETALHRDVSPDVVARRLSQARRHGWLVDQPEHRFGHSADVVLVNQEACRPLDHASGIPACRVATTGSPLAPASRMETGIPSQSPEGASMECCTKPRAFRISS